MARAKGINYRIGVSHNFPYLSVKRDDRYVYIGSAPKMDSRMMAMCVQDLEDGEVEVERLWGWAQNELPYRAYHILHNLKPDEMETIGISRSDVGVVAAFAFYPTSYEAEISKDRITRIISAIVRNEWLASALDEHYWDRGLLIADGELLVPVPHTTKDDKYELWMFDSIINLGKRYRRPIRL